MTDGQIKAMFTLLEYLAKQVVDIKRQLSEKRLTQAQAIRYLRERNAKLLAEKIQLKQQLDELLKFK